MQTNFSSQKKTIDKIKEEEEKKTIVSRELKAEDEIFETFVDPYENFTIELVPLTDEKIVEQIEENQKWFDQNFSKILFQTQNPLETLIPEEMIFS